MLPERICAAFAANGPAVRLTGGAGTCWRVGDVVLKPGQHRRVGPWLAAVFAGLESPDFQVPQPIRAADGSWLVDGWMAWQRVDGEPDPLRHWPEVVATTQAFNKAIADVTPPRWIGKGDNQWSIADRVAWGDQTVELTPELADLVTSAREAIRPLDLPSQLIHGDIAGNILFAAGQLPTVIDFSPYWRPAGYPLAIAAVDLLTWQQAPDDILDILTDPNIDQLLLRAFVFRTVTESIRRPDADTRLTVRRASEPVLDLLLSRVTGRGRSGVRP